jgi:hypothetical protein
MSELVKNIITLLFLFLFIQAGKIDAQAAFFANVIYECPPEVDSFKLAHKNYLHIWDEGGHSFFEIKLNIISQTTDTIISFKDGEESRNVIFITPVEGDINLKNYSDRVEFLLNEKIWEFGFHFHNYVARIAGLNKIKITKIKCSLTCGDNGRLIKIQTSRSRKIRRAAKSTLARCNSDHFHFIITNFHVNINGINYTFDRMAHPQLQASITPTTPTF